MSDLKTVHLRISGRVQGVWYRAWTQQTATELGLRGWVRNRSDGTVEAMASGTEDQLSRLIEKCWSGPELARVDTITFEETDADLPIGFHKKDTI